MFVRELAAGSHAPLPRFAGPSHGAAAAALAGASALAYELLWTRLLALALGHEQLGVLSVLAGFFLGIAIGAASSHARADRLREPGRVFAALQFGAAIYAVASIALLGRGSGRLTTWLGDAPSPTSSVALAAVLMLPATAAIGASLPLLVAAHRRASSSPHGHDDARGLARLYALDTLGATVGVLATVHLLLPRLGVLAAAIVAAALGIAAAGMSLRVRADADATSRVHATPTIGQDDPDKGLLRERWLLYVMIAATGTLGLGLEVIGVRVLAQVLSGTIYSFADLLAVWLLGTGVGAGVYARMSARALGRRPATVLVALLLALAASVALAAVVVTTVPTLLDGLGPASASWARRQLAEFMCAALVLGPPTMLMGACFAHLLALIAAPQPTLAGSREPPRGQAIGGALALNALAAALAPFLFGLWALRSLSYAEAWALIAWGYLLLALGFAWMRRFARAHVGIAAIAGGLLIILSGAVAPSLVLVEDEGEGWTLVERREGPLGVVAVSRTTMPPGSSTRPLMRLRVDRHYRMGGALSIGERRMGHLAALWAGLEAGDAALFLGLGTGATAGAALSYPIVELTAVELIPEVVEMLPHFEAINAGLRDDSRARIIAADARRFVQADTRQYALIVADLFHPARDGAGSLYTREHFEAVRRRLAPGGLFVQWLPLYQLDWASLQMIVQTFLAVYPHAHASLALYNVETPALGLFGSNQAIVIDHDALARSLADPRHADTFTELALLDPRDFLAGYMLDRDGLLALAGTAPIHDDLHPRLDLHVPKLAPDPLRGVANLEQLLVRRRAWPDALLRGGDGAYRKASERFADALEHYLRAEFLRVRAITAGEPWMTEAVHLHYLQAYELEPEFLPAIPRLYAAAEASPELAERLLPSMLETTPTNARVHRAWLDHLARIGDQARYEQARIAAEAALTR